MEPKIVNLGSLILAGQPYYGNPEGGAFGKAWERFNAQRKSMTGRVNPKMYYGLEVYGPEFMAEHRWTYMPSVEVKDLADLSGLFFGKVLPASKYAVYTATKGLASIPDAFMYVYNTWLPASGYEVAYPYDFELYDDDRFHEDGPDEQIDVYIPVKEKKA
jgi:AraC family transcriptional regulator